MTKEEEKEVKPKKSKAETLWDSVKEKELLIFGLANQKVKDYCKAIAFNNDHVVLSLKASAALPALEECVREFEFEITADGKYVMAKLKAGK